MKSCSITLLESFTTPVTISQASHSLFQTVQASTRVDASSRNQHGNIIVSWHIFMASPRSILSDIFIDILCEIFYSK